MRVFYLLQNFLFGLFRPSFWVMINTYSKALDDFFLDGMKRGEVFTNIGSYHASFMGKSIWVSNYPYGAFTFSGQKSRPSRTTINKLNELLMKSRLASDN